MCASALTFCVGLANFFNVLTSQSLTAQANQANGQAHSELLLHSRFGFIR